MLDVSCVAAVARPVVQQAAAVYLRHMQPWFVGLLIHGSALKGGFTLISLTRFLDECLALSGIVRVRFLVARHVHQSRVQRVPFRPRENDAMDHRSPESDAQPLPVLIVGGGLVGLSMSLFLAWRGVSSVLVEKHPVAGRWNAAYGVGATGAVLVRPDGFVAWRSSGRVTDPQALLAQALGRVLGKA
jgi:hypothetical protein